MMNTQLTVIIPVFNEINSIEQLLIKVLNNKIDKQIIVVDDYSSDGTRELLINKFKNKVDKIIFVHFLLRLPSQGFFYEK